MSQTRTDHDQYPASKDFDMIVQEYLENLSAKKRDKALVNQHRYSLILQVLKDPKNTSISTAQFRFWVKKMFQLRANVVCHDNKPVAMREQIYDILVKAHRKAYHGGRDKTSALVRRRYSWIPKELIARFVRHCPFCISRRNGLTTPVAPTPTQPEVHHPVSDYADLDDPLYPSPSSLQSLVSMNARAIATSAAAAAVAAAKPTAGVTTTASTPTLTVPMPSMVTTVSTDPYAPLVSPLPGDSLYYTSTESSEIMWSDATHAKKHWNDSPSSCSSLLTPSPTQLGMVHPSSHSYDPFFMMEKYQASDVANVAAANVAAQSAAAAAAAAAASVAVSPFSFIQVPLALPTTHPTSPSHSLPSSCSLSPTSSYDPTFFSSHSDTLLVQPIHSIMPRHSI